jgi:PEP-CTERM motif
MKTQIALCAAAIALLSTSVLASPPGTIVNNFTVNGTAVVNDSFNFGITSTSFADFNTALGTLTGVTLSFRGTATSVSNDQAFLDNVSTASDVVEPTFQGEGMWNGPASFPIAANETVNFDLSLFEGSGTQALVFNFFEDGGTVTMSGQSGTLTYDFTPVPVASVPEPSTWAMGLIGFGLLGLLGYRKTRGDNALA